MPYSALATSRRRKRVQEEELRLRSEIYEQIFSGYAALEAIKTLKKHNYITQIP